MINFILVFGSAETDRKPFFKAFSPFAVEIVAINENLVR
jgi:hypothetical protein